MSEIQCKTRSGLLDGGHVPRLSPVHAPYRGALPRNVTIQGFVPLFNGQDWSGWETTGNWGFEPDGVL